MRSVSPLRLFRMVTQPQNVRGRTRDAGRCDEAGQPLAPTASAACDRLGRRRPALSEPRMIGKPIVNAGRTGPRPALSRRLVAVLAVLLLLALAIPSFDNMQVGTFIDDANY